VPSPAGSARVVLARTSEPAPVSGHRHACQGAVVIAVARSGAPTRPPARRSRAGTRDGTRPYVIETGGQATFNRSDLAQSTNRPARPHARRARIAPGSRRGISLDRLEQRQCRRGRARPGHSLYLFFCPLAVCRRFVVRASRCYFFLDGRALGPLGSCSSDSGLPAS